LRGIPCLHAPSPPICFLHPVSYQVNPRQGLATEQRPDTGSGSLTRNTRGASPAEPGAGALKATTARNPAGYPACRPPLVYPPTRRRGSPDPACQDRRFPVARTPPAVRFARVRSSSLAGVDDPVAACTRGLQHPCDPPEAMSELVAEHECARNLPREGRLHLAPRRRPTIWP